MKTIGLLLAMLLLAWSLYGLCAERSRDWDSVRNHYIATHPVCEACGGKEKLEVHHVIPVSQNGTDEDENLITLCEWDHFVLGHLHDWRAWNPKVREHVGVYREWMKGRKR